MQSIPETLYQHILSLIDIRLLLIAALLSNTQLYGQSDDSLLQARNYKQFNLYLKQDTINFLVKGLNNSKVKKPVMIFCQGSGSFPLIINDKYGVGENFPFDTRPYLDKYYFIIISKPGVPVISGQLDKDFNYVTDTITNAFPKKFLDNDNLDYYVWQVDKVIDFLIKQPWVDSRKIVLMGHSQGYRVAAKTAVENKRVTQLICTSSNPLGLLYWEVSRQTEMSLKGQISVDSAQANINAIYDGLKKVMMQDEKKMTIPLLGYTSYKNFSSWVSSAKDDLLKLTIPVFVAYGTSDYGRLSNDILPIEFYLHKKFNLTMKAYKNCDHFFTEKILDDKGKVIKTIEHFDEVAKDFFDWLDQH